MLKGTLCNPARIIVTLPPDCPEDGQLILTVAYRQAAGTGVLQHCLAAVDLDALARIGPHRGPPAWLALLAQAYPGRGPSAAPPRFQSFASASSAASAAPIHAPVALAGTLGLAAFAAAAAPAGAGPTGSCGPAGLRPTGHRRLRLAMTLSKSPNNRTTKRKRRGARAPKPRPRTTNRSPRLSSPCSGSSTAPLPEPSTGASGLNR